MCSFSLPLAVCSVRLVVFGSVALIGSCSNSVTIYIYWHILYIKKMPPRMYDEALWPEGLSQSNVELAPKPYPMLTMCVCVL